MFAAIKTPQRATPLLMMLFISVKICKNFFGKLLRHDDGRRLPKKLTWIIFIALNWNITLLSYTDSYFLIFKAFYTSISE